MTANDMVGTLIIVSGGLMLLSVLITIILEWRLLCQRLREMREARKPKVRRKAKLRASEREIELYLSRQRGRQLLSQMDQASEMMWRRDLLQPEARP